MSLIWNAWSPVNLVIDLAFLATTAGFCRRAGLRRGTLYSLFAWTLLTAVFGRWVLFFLMARLAWTFVTVGAPLAAAWLAWRERRPWLWALAAAALALKFYGEVWEPARLEVTRLRVSVDGLKAPVRLVHLSDLQTDGIGPMQLEARAAADAFDPDLVVFTGDVLNHPSLVGEVQDYLRGFKRRSGAFIVSGNVDAGLPWASFGPASGFTLLDAKSAVVGIGPNRLGVLGLGLEDAWDSAVLGRLVHETQDTDARILLSHYPDAMGIARSAPIALLLAGHTHGGQVCLPWWGPIFTLSTVPRAIGAGGLHAVGRLQVLVSRGLGWEGHIAPRVRLFCRPQLLLVELVPPLHPAAPGAKL